MSKYTIRRKGIDGNYQPDTFSADTFAEIRRELNRDGTPWRQAWSVHSDDEVIFNCDDWSEAEFVAGNPSRVTLALVTECRAEAQSRPNIPESWHAEAES